MITVPKIQMALYREYVGSSSLMAPNIFLYHTFESDMIRVTKAGYIIEYEIKLSKSDFKADFKKAKCTVKGFDKQTRSVMYDSTSKHELLVNGAGPNEFYYVFPEDLIKYEDVPTWCGIIVVREPNSNWVRVQKIRRAACLHKTKADGHKLNEIHKSLYYRYWSELSKRNSNQIMML